MQLRSSDQKIEQPNIDQITQVLETLLDAPNSSATLVNTEVSESTYIQTAVGTGNAFILEYQNGSLEEHYRCTNLELTLTHITNAFIWYATGNRRWYTRFKWTPLILQQSTISGDKSSVDSTIYIERLSSTDPEDIMSVAANQTGLLNSYYSTALSQAQRSFRWALAAAITGLVFFLAAIAFLFFTHRQNTTQINVIAGVISVVSGAIVETISGINFLLYGKATTQLAHFLNYLDRTQRLLIANSISESLDGDERVKAKTDLIKSMTTLSPE